MTCTSHGSTHYACECFLKRMVALENVYEIANRWEWTKSVGAKDCIVIFLDLATPKGIEDFEKFIKGIETLKELDEQKETD